MKLKQIESTGIVAEFNGAYWGVQYEDGQSTSYGFGPIENATISNPKYCRSPLDMVHESQTTYRQQLAKARFLPIRKVTIYEIGPD